MKKHEKSKSGGVFCKICLDILCKPRRRKNFRTDSFIICAICRKKYRLRILYLRLLWITKNIPI